MKDAFLKRDWLVVSDEKIADTLTHPEKYFYLIPFMRGEKTLTEAANELSIKPNMLFYQLKRLEKLGLIYLVRTEKRKGRASKVYKASAKRFIIPFKSTSAETMEAIMYRMREPADKKIVERYLKTMDQYTENFGLWLSLSENNLIDMIYAPIISDQWLSNTELLKPDFPALFSKYAKLELEPDVAKSLQHDLIKAFEKAHSSATSKGKSYLLNLSIVPLDD